MHTYVRTYVYVEIFSSGHHLYTYIYVQSYIYELSAAPKYVGEMLLVIKDGNGWVHSTLLNGYKVPSHCSVFHE